MSRHIADVHLPLMQTRVRTKKLFEASEQLPVLSEDKREYVGVSAVTLTLRFEGEDPTQRSRTENVIRTYSSLHCIHMMPHSYCTYDRTALCIRDGYLNVHDDVKKVH
jgi:hypothetical protein